MPQIKFELRRNPLGYFELENLTNNLTAFYEEEYFQKEHGCYRLKKTQLENIYRDNIISLADHIIKKRYSSSSLLDLGCGEGFFAAHFFAKSSRVTCSDLSGFAIQKENPQLLGRFLKTDALGILQKLASDGEKFDIVNLENVLEHVNQPISLLQHIHGVINRSSVLRLRIPNDFSAFQNLLQSHGLTNQHWVNPNEHLTYFNKVGLENILNHCGYEIDLMHTNFPIEVFLANPHSNYFNKKEYGAGAHEARMIIESHLIETDIEGYLDYMVAAAAIGFGREFTVYAKKK